MTLWRKMPLLRLQVCVDVGINVKGHPVKEKPLRGIVLCVLVVPWRWRALGAVADPFRWHRVIVV